MLNKIDGDILKCHGQCTHGIEEFIIIEKYVPSLQIIFIFFIAVYSLSCCHLVNEQNYQNLTVPLSNLPMIKLALSDSQNQNMMSEETLIVSFCLL